MKVRGFLILLFLGLGLSVFWRFIWLKHPVEFEWRDTAPTGLPVFMFHETAPRELEEVFAHIQRNGYHTLGAAEFAEIVTGQRSFTGKEVVLTFDDARLCLWTTTAVLLKKYGLKGIAFVIPYYLEEGSLREQKVRNKLSYDDINLFCRWSEIREMKDQGLMDVQSHSWSHLVKYFKSPGRHLQFRSEIFESLKKSKDELTSRGYGPQEFFCAPTGNMSPTLIELAREAGYSHVVGVSPEVSRTTFLTPQNDFSNQDFIYRLNYRSIYSLPGEGRETFVGRVFRRLIQGGDRIYDTEVK